jgi:hypothetical protein
MGTPKFTSPRGGVEERFLMNAQTAAISSPPFAITPVDLFGDLEHSVGSGVLRCYQSMAAHARPQNGNKVFLKNSTIAKETGRSERTVSRNKTILESLGWITRTGKIIGKGIVEYVVNRIPEPPIIPEPPPVEPLGGILQGGYDLSGAKFCIDISDHTDSQICPSPSYIEQKNVIETTTPPSSVLFSSPLSSLYGATCMDEVVVLSSPSEKDKTPSSHDQPDFDSQKVDKEPSPPSTEPHTIQTPSQSPIEAAYSDSTDKPIHSPSEPSETPEEASTELLNGIHEIPNLTDNQQTKLSKMLVKISEEKATDVLTILKRQMEQGTVINPISYTYVLIKKANENKLKIPQPSVEPSEPVPDQKEKTVDKNDSELSITIPEDAPLTDEEKQIASNRLQRIKDQSLRNAVLSEWDARLKKAENGELEITSKIGYLVSLINRAMNGEFTPTRDVKKAFYKQKSEDKKEQAKNFIDGLSPEEREQFEEDMKAYTCLSTCNWWWLAQPNWNNDIAEYAREAFAMRLIEEKNGRELDREELHHRYQHFIDTRT